MDRLQFARELRGAEIDSLSLSRYISRKLKLLGTNAEVAAEGDITNTQLSTFLHKAQLTQSV